MEQVKQGVTIWTAAQRRYIDWVATPDDLKEPSTQTEYVSKYATSRTTLWRWSKIPGFYAAVQERTREYLGNALPEVLTTLKVKAIEGSFPHMKMYLEMLGMYTPRTDVNVNIRQEVERLAKEAGLNEGEIMAEVEKILAGQA